MIRLLGIKLRVIFALFVVAITTQFGNVLAAQATTTEYVVTEIPNAPILIEAVIDYHGVTYTGGRDRTSGVDHMYTFDGTTFTEVPGTYGMIDPVIFNDKLLFMGYTASGYSAHVYEYDGTTIRDLVEVGMLSSLDMLVVFNGVLYIGNNNSATNYETYKYTGTGTPARVASLPIGLETPIVFGNKLYVRGWHSPGTYDLYSIDTNDTVTQLTTDISPSMLTVANNKLYYFGYINYPASFTRQLYYFDGANTVADVSGGSTGYSPVTFNNSVYFVPNLNSQLRQISTSQIDSITLTSTDGPVGRPQQIMPFDGRLFVRSYPTSGFVESIWVTDLTTTNLVPGLTYNLRMVGVAQNKLLIYTNFNSPTNARLYIVTNPAANVAPSGVNPTNTAPDVPTLAATGAEMANAWGLAALFIALGLLALAAKRRSESI